MRDKPKYYIDACCFIEWMKSEETRNQGADVFAGICRLIDDLENGRFDLISSVMLLAEVRHTDRVIQERLNRFRYKLSRLSNARIVDLWLVVRATNLAERCNLKAIDSIHLATAINYRANALFTTDDKLLSLPQEHLYLQDGGRGQIQKPVDGFKIIQPRPESTLL